MSLRSMAVEAYLRWLRSQVSRGPIPQHVAIVMDGNRRWARGQGFANVSVGHRYGAEHLETVLDWCAALGIRQLSVYVASADNLAKRSPGEVAVLMEVAEHVIARRLARPDGRWQIHVAGRLGLVPDSTRHALKLAEEATRNRAIDGHPRSRSGMADAPRWSMPCAPRSRRQRCGG